MSWDWSSFMGSPTALAFNRRDLPALDRVIDCCPERRVAVQAGGHLGLFPKRLAESFDVVYTFEPAPDLFAALCQNAPDKRIVKLQAALGCERGTVGVSQHRRDASSKPSHEGLTHVVPHGTVPVLKVDDLGLSACDLICLDLEGFEWFALMGATATLRRCRPVLSIEINKQAQHYGYGPTDLHAWLSSVGYEHIGREAQDDLFAPRTEVAA